MAHRVDGRKLGRKAGPRRALYRNLIVAVLRYEQVRTTEAKPRRSAVRSIAFITLAKDGSLPAGGASSPSCGRAAVIDKLFKEIAPQVLRPDVGLPASSDWGRGAGDAAPIVQIELV